MLPVDPFARIEAPADFSRADRVRMIDAVATVLLEGPPAARFVGSALASWLRDPQERSLESFLRVHERGSHKTPQRIFAAASSVDDDKSDGVT